MRLDTCDLIRRGEEELANANRSARKTLERARRDLLRQRDVDGLERLLVLSRRLDDDGDLAYAVLQNIRFLDRQAELRSSPASGRAPAAKPGTRTFVFGDPCRPRSLALALVVSFATFPVAWFGLLILYGLGEGDFTGHTERTLVVLAAIPASIGGILAALDWVRARRSYPPEARGPLAGPEGILCATVILAAAWGAVGLGAWLWSLDL